MGLSDHMHGNLPNIIHTTARFKPSTLKMEAICSPLKFNRRFPGTCRIDLQCEIIRPLLAIYFHTSFLLGLFINPEDGDNMFLRNV
jgi:hypothetical protein